MTFAIGEGLKDLVAINVERRDIRRASVVKDKYDVSMWSSLSFDDSSTISLDFSKVVQGSALLDDFLTVALV